MAISIGANFSYNGKLFIDDRQGLAKNKSDLKNWSLVIPEGFEIYLESEGDWYIYKSTNNDPETGKFLKRDKKSDEEIGRIDEEINRIDGEISRIDGRIDDTNSDLESTKQTIQNNYDILDQKINTVNDKIDDVSTSLDEKIEDTNNKIDSTITDIENLHSVLYADTLEDLTKEVNWVFDGKLYARVGIIVSVINDGDKNGSYRLKASDYKNINNWIKILDYNDIINTIEDKDPTDYNVYSAKKADSRFLRKDIPETITQDWVFEKNITANNINLGENQKKVYVDPETGEAIVDVDKIIANASDIKDLGEKIWENTDIGVTNILRNSGFNGEYDSLELNSDRGMADITSLYNQRNEFWSGYGTWEIEENPAAISGFGAKMIGADSFLEQEIRNELLLSGQSYTVSFKSKGSITVYIDGNSMSCRSSEYNLYKLRFTYSGTKNISLRFVGMGNICDIKLERGNVSTDWTRSDQDSDPVKDKFKDLEYLRTAFGNENGDMTSGFVLKNVMQIGENSEEGATIKAGISGIYGDGNIFLWSGGSFKEASSLASYLSNVNNNPEKIKESNINFLLTYGGKLYIDQVFTNSVKEIGTEETEETTKLIRITKYPTFTSGDKRDLFYETESFSLTDKEFHRPIFITSRINFTINDSENYANGVISISNPLVPFLHEETYLQGEAFYTPIFVKQRGLLEDCIYARWSFMTKGENLYSIRITLDDGDRQIIYKNPTFPENKYIYITKL